MSSCSHQKNSNWRREMEWKMNFQNFDWAIITHSMYVLSDGGVRGRNSAPKIVIIQL